MKAQSHLWLWQLGAIWGTGLLSSCISSTVESVCAMKGIPIGPLAEWGKDLTYYLTPFFCLVNWDMYYPGNACRGTDLPPCRILYIHTQFGKRFVQSHVKLTYSICYLGDFTFKEYCIFFSRTISLLLLSRSQDTVALLFKDLFVRGPATYKIVSLITKEMTLIIVWRQLFYLTFFLVQHSLVFITIQSSEFSTQQYIAKWISFELITH